MDNEEAFRKELINGIAGALALYAKLSERHGGAPLHEFASQLAQNLEAMPDNPETGSQSHERFEAILLRRILHWIDLLETGGKPPLHLVPGGRDGHQSD